jgi:hypothetical protein
MEEQRDGMRGDGEREHRDDLGGKNMKAGEMSEMRRMTREKEEVRGAVEVEEGRT